MPKKICIIVSIHGRERSVYSDLPLSKAYKRTGGGREEKEFLFIYLFPEGFFFFFFFLLEVFFLL